SRLEHVHVQPVAVVDGARANALRQCAVAIGRKPRDIGVDEGGVRGTACQREARPRRNRREGAARQIAHAAVRLLAAEAELRVRRGESSRTNGGLPRFSVENVEPARMVAIFGFGRKRALYPRRARRRPAAFAVPRANFMERSCVWASSSAAGNASCWVL